MKGIKVLYYVTTSIVSIIFLFSAIMYFSNYDMVKGFFEMLEFPTWVVYPLAVAKILAVITLWVKPKRVLVEWAYAGLFFDSILAFVSHIFADHGVFTLALLALVVTLLSRIFYGMVFISPKAIKA